MNAGICLNTFFSTSGLRRDCAGIPFMIEGRYIFCPCMGFIMNTVKCLHPFFRTGGFLSNYSAIPLMTKRIYIFCPCMRFIMYASVCPHSFFRTGRLRRDYAIIPLMTEGRYNLMLPTQLISAYRAVHYLIIGTGLFAGSLNHILPDRCSRSVSCCRYNKFILIKDLNTSELILKHQTTSAAYIILFASCLGAACCL